MSPQLMAESASIVCVNACVAESAAISSVIDPEPSSEKSTSTFLQPFSHIGPPPCAPEPIDAVPPVVPTPPVELAPPVPPVPFGFTQMSLKHWRPESQAPPSVQGHFSLPTGQSPPLVSASLAAHAEKDSAITAAQIAAPTGDIDAMRRSIVRP